MQNLIDHTSKFLILTLCAFYANPTLCTDHRSDAGSSRVFTYKEYKEAVEKKAMQGTLQELLDKCKGDLSIKDLLDLSSAVIRLTEEEKDLRMSIVRRAEAEIAAKYLLSTDDPEKEEKAARLRGK